MRGLHIVGSQIQMHAAPKYNNSEPAWYVAMSHLLYPGMSHIEAIRGPLNQDVETARINMGLRIAIKGD